MVDEVLSALAPHSGNTRYIDGTVGAGGHAYAILTDSGPDSQVLGLDGDPEAIAIAHATLGAFGDRIKLVNANFNNLSKVAIAEDFVPANGVLLDLGLSSIQLSNKGRGFSFESESLDMRMDPQSERTAADLVNELPETQLADLIYRYGEEHFSRRIARRIVQHRPFQSARQLAEVIETTVKRRGKTHPATRTFQALRIAINRELENLESVLPQLRQVTVTGSRVAFITFHSLEDRIVKNFFKKNSDWKNLTKHPLKPQRQEILANPRARSARLRVVERI